MTEPHVEWHPGGERTRSAGTEVERLRRERDAYHAEANHYRDQYLQAAEDLIRERDAARARATELERQRDNATTLMSKYYDELEEARAVVKAARSLVENIDFFYYDERNVRICFFCQGGTDDGEYEHFKDCDWVALRDALAALDGGDDAHG